MATEFLEQTITSIPGGYTLYSTLPLARLASRVVVPEAEIDISFHAFWEGEVRFEQTHRVTVRNRRIIGEEVCRFVLPSTGDDWKPEPGFVEFSFTSADDRPIFKNKRPLPFYSIYSCLGKKSFLVDNIYKFGSPPVIDQIAEFGRFTDAHPVIDIDLDRDFGESLILINPYRRPVLARILTSDGRKPPRKTIPPRSARYFRLHEILDENERQWLGQVQITANNRLLTYSIKHSIADPYEITAHEHTDPFRADPTHMPATQWFRAAIGLRLQRIGLLKS